MYPVTQAYRDSMSGQIRGAVTAEGELLNVDAYVQGGMTVTSTSALSGCSVAEISDPTADKLQEVATFEQDYLRTDGSQVFMDSYTPDYYISSSLSAATPNAGGVYPITAAVSAEIDADWSFGAQPVTIVFDEAVAHVSVTLSYMDGSTETSFIASHPVENGIVVIPQLTNVTRYTGLTVTITSLNKPNRRARIKKIYAGTRRLLTGNEIISLKYSDENDGVGLELPSKTVALSIDNVGHQYTMETEYENPSFHPLHTQLIFRVGYDVYGTGGAWEWVPFPKMYLSSYQVNDETVDFTFTDPIGRLNGDDCTHYWSKPGTGLAMERIGEVMMVNQEIYDDARHTQVQTAPQRLAVSIDTSGARSMSMPIKNSIPPVSAAQALQLCGNLMGNILRSRRSIGQTLEIISPPTQPTVHISADEMFSFPAWEAGDRPVGFDVTVQDTVDKGTTADISRDAGYTVYGNLSYDTDKPIKLVYIENERTGGGSHAPSFAYRAYEYRGYDSQGFWTDIIGMDVYDIVTENIACAYSGQSGIIQKLSNPLAAKSIAEAYAEMMYDELQHNMSADLSHRGFPELDAGDVITFETENRPSVTGRVIKNEFEIKAGSMSGSTKVRRLS